MLSKTSLPRPLRLFALVLCASPLATLFAQNGLHDIPDTSFDAQKNAFKVVEGASINLFAHEPLVRDPVHMNWDQRGRLWVVGSPLYPLIKPGQEEHDRIVILEDTDGDGVADKNTVFADNLHIPTAILPGDGGVYVANSIEILFLEDTDGDDVADKRKVVLSGFGTEDTHHLVHTFRWGPEGTIWMNQSIYIHTHLETPYGIRRLLGGGMWYYRPETERAEVFMKGLVNPWGHAFDTWGQSFLTDGAGSEGINFVFPRAVFKTSPGASRTLSGLNPGQPKHCGLEVLTGANVPEELRGVLAAPDFRGNRINMFRLTDNGSAYTSTQIEDLVTSSHKAFRPIDVKMGPDGAIYIADWYNPIIQHGEVDFRDPRRDHEHGRIWRITFDGRDLLKKPDLKGASDTQLVSYLNADDGWSRELAMVEMRERDKDAMLKALQETTAPEGVDPDLAKLRYVWGTQALNRFDKDAAAELLSSTDHKVRAGALRALYYSAGNNPEALAIAGKAVADPHPQVRLWAVSVLAQLDSPDTVRIALKALEGVEVDEFLDFALWSICREHADRWITEAQNGNPFDTVKELLFAVRALNQPVAIPQILSALESGELSGDKNVADVADLVSKVGSADQLEQLFNFALKDSTSETEKQILLESLVSAGKLRKLRPSGDEARLAQFLQSNNVALFSSAASLAGLWKLESARPGLKEAFEKAPENQARARAAMDGLISLGGPATAKLFDELASNHTAPFLLRSLAVIGRTKMNPAAGAKIAVAVLRDAPEGKDPNGIFDTFLANKKGPPALAAVLNQESLPEAIALTGVLKASSAATKPQGLVAALQKAGGLKPMKMSLTNAEMETMMNKIATTGDPHRGEAIYRRATLQCSVCHAIGGAGGIIGPDLVSIGASAPVDYLVTSLLQPSDKIKEGYHTTLITLKNGDSFAGAIAREDNNEIVIRDAAGVEHRVPKNEIVSNNISPVSLMPPGLTATLREDEFIDLVSFLSHLGKDGDFKTPPNRFVRHWQALSPHERTRDAVGHWGKKIFAEDVDTYVWSNFYAEVAGGLPVDEMPEVVGRGKNRYSVARTFLDVSSPGEIRLKVRGKLKDLTLLLGEKEIALPEDGTEAEIILPIESAGRKKLTIAGLRGWGLDLVSIEALDDAGKVSLPTVSEF